MSDGRIAARWRALRAEGRSGLVPYLPAGFPDRATSLSALRLAAERGADVLEVGIPFSDPLADGPVIQRASFEALRRGMTVGGMLALVREAALEIPVVAFTYLNPILAYGTDRFLEDAAAAGVSGLLITDLPVGADPTLEDAVAASPLARIRLLAPTTPRDRLADAVARAEGFLYLIARLGVTGAPTTVGARVEEAVARVRAVSDLPVAVGFGIGSGAQARAVAGFADGVVVGSALVRRLEDGLDAAGDLLHELREALDAVPAG